MSAATRVSSSSSVAQPARVKRARSDAGASREQALAIPPPDGENGGGGVGGGTGNVYLDSPSQDGGSGDGGVSGGTGNVYRDSPSQDGGSGDGGGIRPHVSKARKTRSKHMMTVLRYPHPDVQRDSDGWAPLDQVMHAMRLRYTKPQIMDVVENNLYPDGRPRFETRDGYIRACKRRQFHIGTSRESGATRWFQC